MLSHLTFGASSSHQSAGVTLPARSHSSGSLKVACFWCYCLYSSRATLTSSSDGSTAVPYTCSDDSMTASGADRNERRADRNVT